MMMQCDGIFISFHLDLLVPSVLLECRQETVKIYDSIKSGYFENIRPKEEKQDVGELAQFLFQYLKWKVLSVSLSGN